MLAAPLKETGRMRHLLGAVIVILVALGVQLAMVAGALRPNLALAMLGYAALFFGAVLIVPAALRHAAQRNIHRTRPDTDTPRLPTPRLR
ncbi:MAG: hypothetical protein EA339_05635 [Rhodobacteraceae bacterium]|nr:MAG: hypothetical protein EA339_05635 [Paracoccaceae bacterium]